MEQHSYQNAIDLASTMIGNTWPLYSFVTSNPLSGYENTPFENAVEKVANLRNTTTFPESKSYRYALAQGKIDATILRQMLDAENHIASTEEYLDNFERLENVQKLNTNNQQRSLDQIMVKWLMVFLDEGLAEWQMPNKEKGFYAAWRKLALYDKEINIDAKKDIPETAALALQNVLAPFSTIEIDAIFEYHLAALPGWVGYIKHRQDNQTEWQKIYPITITDYLAVRLTIAAANADAILPAKTQVENQTSHVHLQYIFLKAWEKSWQTNLVKNLKLAQNLNPSVAKNNIPEAQFVFCIDTRSELIRRNVEQVGNYETFGYAGFFGIAMDYKSPENGLTRKSCPPIVTSAYKVIETPQEGKSTAFTKYQTKQETKHFSNYFLRRMKNMLPSAFGYVEGSGLFYGGSLLSRTLVPAATYNSKKENEASFENCCEATIQPNSDEDSALNDISLTEKVGIVKGAFDGMGWQEFAPLVLFVGHGSHTANNAFGSSLDCGACAASPGRHNARMLAALANLPEVRMELLLKHQLEIPSTTFFLGAEHNTTTDEILIFDNALPQSHQSQLEMLRKSLDKAQETATAERLQNNTNSIAIAHKKATNWSETRPEWGLAKNAGFIIGPRSLTSNFHMDGNCFLNSYSWKLDTDGSILTGIMQGPMVVTQWINNHYYFSTVDNENFGSGSKITHNITGKFGVVQGNGGDLKMGLPLQSVKETDSKMYHEPLRLSVVIQAPKDRVQTILLQNENLKALLDNEWIYLLVMDPTLENTFFQYEKNGIWNAMIDHEIAALV